VFGKEGDGCVLYCHTKKIFLIAGLDYTPFAGLELEFTRQTTSQEVSLAIVNNDIYEQVETVEVGLADARVMSLNEPSVSPSRVATSGSPALVTITDDDGEC